jgi:transposase-like protein
MQCGHRCMEFCHYGICRCREEVEVVCRCGGSKIKRKGLTSSGKQRWLCQSCGVSWSKLRKQYKRYSRSSIFEQWLSGATIKDLSSTSKLSRTHIQRILIDELMKDAAPP